MFLSIQIHITSGWWVQSIMSLVFSKQEVSREAKKPHNTTLKLLGPRKKKWFEALNLGKQASGEVFRTRCICIVLVLTSSREKHTRQLPNMRHTPKRNIAPASHPKGAMLVVGLCLTWYTFGSNGSWGRQLTDESQDEVYKYNDHQYVWTYRLYNRIMNSG